MNLDLFSIIFRLNSEVSRLLNSFLGKWLMRYHISITFKYRQCYIILWLNLFKSGLICYAYNKHTYIYIYIYKHTHIYIYIYICIYIMQSWINASFQREVDGRTGAMGTKPCGSRQTHKTQPPHVRQVLAHRRWKLGRCSGVGVIGYARVVGHHVWICYSH